MVVGFRRSSVDFYSTNRMTFGFQLQRVLFAQAFGKCIDSSAS